MAIPQGRLDALWYTTTEPASRGAMLEYLRALLKGAQAAGPSGAYLAELYQLGLDELAEFYDDLFIGAVNDDAEAKRIEANLRRGYV